LPALVGADARSALRHALRLRRAIVAMIRAAFNRRYIVEADTACVHGEATGAK
jgi:elongation factor P--beta-lysine ligase